MSSLVIKKKMIPGKMLKLLGNTTMFGFIVLITLDVFEQNVNRIDSLPTNCILPETNKRIMYEEHGRRKT
jgi:hypothetical protein